MTVNGPFALLGDGRFFRVWVAGGFVGTMRWLEILVIGVFTLEVTGSAFRRALAGAIDHLPERERQVMGLYYDEALNLREIGAVLGVTESRVCQIHAQAVVRLRARLQAWL